MPAVSGPSMSFKDVINRSVKQAIDAANNQKPSIGNMQDATVTTGTGKKQKLSDRPNMTVSADDIKKAKDEYDSGYRPDMSDEDRKWYQENQLNEDVELDTSNAPIPDVDQQVLDRFKQNYSGSNMDGSRVPTGWTDTTTGEKISDDQKSELEAQMRQDYATAVQEREGKNDQSDASSTGEAISNVANGVPSRDNLDGRDFSDDFNTWLAASGLGYGGAGDFMFNGTRDEWRDFVQNEAIRDYYSDLYDANGDFSDELFDAYWLENKPKTYNDMFTIADGDATYSGSDFIGGDYDTFEDVIRYLYDNDGLNYYGNSAGDYQVTDQDDRQTFLDALAQEYMVNAATRALASGDLDSFRQSFSTGDINRFMKNDDYEVGSILDGYQTAEELGRQNVDPYAMFSGAYAYDDGSGRVIPVQGLDNVLAALGEGYGAKKRSDR